MVSMASLISFSFSLQDPLHSHVLYGLQVTLAFIIHHFLRPLALLHPLARHIPMLSPAMLHTFVSPHMGSTK